MNHIGQGSDRKRARMEEHYQAEMDIADQHNKYYGKKYQIEGIIVPPSPSTNGPHAVTSPATSGMVKVKEDFAVYPDFEDFEDDDSQRDEVMKQVHGMYPMRSFKQPVGVQANAEHGLTVAPGGKVLLAPMKSGMESYRTDMSSYRIDASVSPGMADYAASQKLSGKTSPMANINWGASKPQGSE